MIKVLREKLLLKPEEEKEGGQEGGMKGRKGHKMGKEGRKEGEEATGSRASWG